MQFPLVLHAEIKGTVDIVSAFEILRPYVHTYI